MLLLGKVKTPTSLNLNRATSVTGCELKFGENSVLAAYEQMQLQKATIRKVKADALRPFQVLLLFYKAKVEIRRRASVFGTFFAKKVHKRRAFDLIRRDKVAKKTPTIATRRDVSLCFLEK